VNVEDCVGDAAAAVGEVIAVTTSGIIAQSYQLNEAPPYGSLVLTRGPDGRVHYGLCSGFETGGIEPGRHAMAWGTAGDEEIDVYVRQPQLAHVLRTTFASVLVGYQPASGSIVQRVPPQPPRVHERVWSAERSVARSFFDGDFAYVRFLLRSGAETVEDLIAASIGYAYHARGGDRAFLVQAGREVARLLAGDHARLTAILELLTAIEEES
jgi:hypothetical protein